MSNFCTCICYNIETNLFWTWLPSYGDYISQLVRCARFVLAFSISILKNLLISSKLLTQGYRYYMLRKTFGIQKETSTKMYTPFLNRIKLTTLTICAFRVPSSAKFFRSYSDLSSKFVGISFQEYLSKGISNTVFDGDLVYKLRSVKSAANFVSSGSKIVKRFRPRDHREDDRSCAWPFYSRSDLS